MKKNLFVALMALVLLASFGCAAPAEPAMDVHAVWTDIEGSLEMPAMMALDAETLGGLYAGLPMDKVAEFEAHIAMMNVHAAEIAIFEATDAKAAEEIKTALESRQDALEEQWAMYLPEQHALVQEAIVEVEGKYAYLIIGEFAADAKAKIDEALSAE